MQRKKKEAGPNQVLNCRQYKNNQMRMAKQKKKRKRAKKKTTSKVLRQTELVTWSTPFSSRVCLPRKLESLKIVNSIEYHLVIKGSSKLHLR